MLERVEKWLMLLQEFDINVVNQKLVKGHAIADLIAEFPQNQEVVVHKEFLNIFQEEAWCQWHDELIMDISGVRLIKFPSQITTFAS